VKRFDYIKLAEAPFKNVAHCNDRETFVMIAPIPNSVLIEGLFFFWRPNFKLMLYSCICSITVLCKCHKPYNDTINDMLRSNNHCSIGFTQWCRGRGCRGCKRTNKSFDLVKLREKSREVCAKSVKTFAKSLKIWANFSKTQAKNGSHRSLI